MTSRGILRLTNPAGESARDITYLFHHCAIVATLKGFMIVELHILKQVSRAEITMEVWFPVSRSSENQKLIRRWLRLESSRVVDEHL